MKISFDAKRAFYNKSGLGNYSRNLIHALYKFFPENTYSFYTPKIKNRIHLEKEEGIQIITPQSSFFKFFSSYWRTKQIGRIIEKENPEIYHGLSHELPIIRKKTNRTKYIVTIHDLIFMRFPKFYTLFDRIIHIKKVKYACKKADQIVAISEQTKSDLVEFLKIDANKIKVIYQGCNPIFQLEASEEIKLKLKAKFQLPDKYLLYVGTVEKRKNLLHLIKAIHEKNIVFPLVVIGRKTSYFEEIQEYIDANNITDIHFLKFVENTELPSIYQMASCFIYPSVFEGFGIPVLEALFSKTPVITSTGSCFSEAGGPDSIYVDPQNVNAIGDAILSVLSDENLRKNMTEKGYLYAQKFTDKEVAGNYMELYKSMQKEK